MNTLYILQIMFKEGDRHNFSSSQKYQWRHCPQTQCRVWPAVSGLLGQGPGSGKGSARGPCLVSYISPKHVASHNTHNISSCLGILIMLFVLCDLSLITSVSPQHNPVSFLTISNTRHMHTLTQVGYTFMYFYSRGLKRSGGAMETFGPLRGGL